MNLFKCRTKRKTNLQIDKIVQTDEVFSIVNFVGKGDLLSDGYLRVGGYRRLPFGFSQDFYYGFQGCIQGMKIDDRPVDLVRYNLNSNFRPSYCSEN